MGVERERENLSKVRKMKNLTNEQIKKIIKEVEEVLKIELQVAKEKEYLDYSETFEESENYFIDTIDYKVENEHADDEILKDYVIFTKAYNEEDDEYYQDEQLLILEPKQ